MQLHVCVENVFTSLERSTSAEMFSNLAHTEVTFPISRCLFIFYFFFRKTCVYISIHFGKCLLSNLTIINVYMLTQTEHEFLLKCEEIY